MNDVFVAYTSAVSALGGSIDEMWPELCAGDTAIGPVARFATERLEFHDAACIAGLDYAPGGNMVCELAARALDQLPPLPPLSHDTFVIWTGIKGDAEHVENRAEVRAGTGLYLARHYREWACRYLGLPERGLEVNAACASSTVGLAVGARMIAEGRCGSVLVCGADIVSRFAFTGFSSLRGLSASVCRPFDTERDGLCLGDGAAAILLADGATAEAMGLEPLARLTGWGMANDANHITGPARDGRGLVSAIKSALGQARLCSDEVEAFCAHGTGTPYNDAMELTALETVFGSRRFPMFSIKGATGHTLGAAGAMEAAVCVRALAEKGVPATAGLNNPEERAKGRVAGATQPFGGDNILTTNSGFGGCNAALIFERA